MKVNKRSIPVQSLSRREFLKFGVRSILLSAAALAGTALYSDWLEPQWIAIEKLTLPIDRLGSEFNGFKILQISDIHMDDWMDRARLAAIVDRVLSMPTDIITITGDYFTSGVGLRAHGRSLVEELSRLTAARRVYAVLGNHDHWTEPATIRTLLHDAGVRELRNQAVPIDRGAAQLYIAGVDDYWEEKSRLDKVLRQMDNEGPAILLAHEPDFADISAATDRFDLQLSGHSHGGQVVLPLFGPPIVPPLAQKYPLGLYRVGKMWQYTNRGLGMVKPQVRFNCRPEITVIELVSAAAVENPPI
jgi:hypothetical protein